MTRPVAGRAAKVLFVLALGILVQTCFGNDFRLHAVAPDFMLLLAVSAGFAAGPDAGAAVGFAAGLAGDLFLESTPFGLSALALCLTGFTVGWAKANLLRSRLLLVPCAAAAGTVLGVALFVAVGYLVGQEQLVAPGKAWLVEQAVIEACWAAVFSLPAFGLARWALRRAPAGSASLTQAASAVTGVPGRRHMAAARSRRRRRVRAGAR
ncbi:MAG: rod shape-determining protein MreD [Acidimicrobiales bacterium]